MSFHESPAGLPSLHPRVEDSGDTPSGRDSSTRGNHPGEQSMGAVPVREHQIQSAVAFLQSPKTLDRPDSEKIAFLERSAQCTCAEIAEAYRRVFPESEVTKLLQKEAQTSPSASAARVASELSPSLDRGYPPQQLHTRPDFLRAQEAPQPSVWPRVLGLTGLVLGGLYAVASLVPHLFPEDPLGPSAQDSALPATPQPSATTQNPSPESSAGTSEKSSDVRSQTSSPAEPSLPRRWSPAPEEDEFSSRDRQLEDEYHLSWAGAHSGSVERKLITQLSQEVMDLKEELSDVVQQMRKQSHQTRDALSTFQAAMDRFIADDSLSRVTGSGAYNASQLQEDLHSLRSSLETVKSTLTDLSSRAQSAPSPPPSTSAVSPSAPASSTPASSSPSPLPHPAESSEQAAQKSRDAKEERTGPKVGEDALKEALKTLAEENEKDIALKSLQSISFYLKNLLSNLESRGSSSFSRLSRTNPTVKKRICDVPGAEAVLVALGFISKRLMLEWPQEKVRGEAEQNNISIRDSPQVALLTVGQAEVLAASSRLQSHERSPEPSRNGDSDDHHARLSPDRGTEQ